MCSGLFSSSANGASASRASAYFGLSTSTSTERSDWTMNGFAGSNVGAGETGAEKPWFFFDFGGMITVGWDDPATPGRTSHATGSSGGPASGSDASWRAAGLTPAVVLFVKHRGPG